MRIGSSSRVELRLDAYIKRLLVREARTHRGIVSIPVEFNVGRGRAVGGGGLMMIFIRRYGTVLLFVALAFISTLLLQRFFQDPFLFLFFAAVIASAWFGGTNAGFVAVLVSTVLVDYFFLPPFHSFAVDASDIAYFGSFIVCAVVASWVSASMRSTEEALRQARNQLEILRRRTNL